MKTLISALGVGVWAVVVSGLTAGCIVDRTVDLDRTRYMTPVAEAQAAGVAAYWLGPSFQAGGNEYSYIQARYPEGIAGVQVQGLQMSYFSGDREDWVLDIKTISLSEWALVEDAVRHPIQAKPDRSEIRVAGLDAELLTYSNAVTRPINGYQLILETAQSAVVVLVPSVGSATPGRKDRNPLIDLPTFLTVMENLQPYSQ